MALLASHLKTTKTKVVFIGQEGSGRAEIVSALSASDSEITFHDTADYNTDNLLKIRRVIDEEKPALLVLVIDSLYGDDGKKKPKKIDKLKEEIKELQGPYVGNVLVVLKVSVVGDVNISDGLQMPFIQVNSNEASSVNNIKKAIILKLIEKYQVSRNFIDTANHDNKKDTVVDSASGNVLLLETKPSAPALNTYRSAWANALSCLDCLGFFANSRSQLAKYEMSQLLKKALENNTSGSSRLSQRKTKELLTHQYGGALRNGELKKLFEAVCYQLSNVSNVKTVSS